MPCDVEHQSYQTGHLSLCPWRHASEKMAFWPFGMVSVPFDSKHLSGAETQTSANQIALSENQLSLNIFQNQGKFCTPQSRTKYWAPERARRLLDWYLNLVLSLHFISLNLNNKNIFVSVNLLGTVILCHQIIHYKMLALLLLFVMSVPETASYSQGWEEEESSLYFLFRNNAFKNET